MRKFSRFFSGLAMTAAAITGLSLSNATANANDFYAFGDSLVDNGNIPRITGLDLPPSPYFANRFSNGPTFAEYLGALLDLQSPIGSNAYGTGYNFGVGGALSGVGNFLLPETSSGLSSQVNYFTSLGGRFDAHDLVAVWAGANDYFVLASDIQKGVIPASQAQAAGALTVVQATNNLAQSAQQFASLGARRMVFLNLPDFSYLPEFRGTPLASTASQLAQAHNWQLASKLAAVHAETGANIIVVDTNLLITQVLAHPSQYGFFNVTTPAIDTAAAFGPQSLQNTFLFWDDVHPTTAGHAFIARYVANMVLAPSTLAAQTQLMTYGSRAFAELIYSQIDPFERLTAANGVSQGDVSKEGVCHHGSSCCHAHDQKGVCQDKNVVFDISRPEFFVLANYRHGERESEFETTGFDYNLGNIALGAQYTCSPMITSGVLLGYGRNQADLDHGLGEVSVDAYQLGGFVTFHGSNWYVGGQLAGGFDDYEIRRPGVLAHSTIKASPEGRTFLTGARGGYFMHFGDLKVGPTASLTFDSVKVDSYSEAGDLVLNQAVEGRIVDSLFGTIGLQATHDFVMGHMILQPYFRAEYEHEFLGDGEAIKTRFVSQPVVGLHTDVEDSSQSYGRLGGGVKIKLNNSLSLRVGASTVLHREDGSEYTVDGGVMLAF